MRLLETHSLRWFLAAVLLSAPAAAAAQQTDAERTAMARALFEEGLACHDAGDLDCAEDRFRRSLAVRSTSSVRFNLAEVRLRQGHVVEPHELLTQVAADEEAPSELRERARERAGALAPRLAHLTVDLRGDAGAVEVWLDGAILDPALVGVSFPVDPGTRTIEARERGEVLAQRTVELVEGARRTLILDLGAARATGPEDEGSDEVLIGVLIGVGAAVLVGGAIAIGVAVGTEDDPFVGNVPPGAIEL